MGITAKELEEKAKSIVEGLDKGFFVDNYPEEMLRLALAYKMLADGQDSELDEIIRGDDFWTLPCVKGFLVKVFGCKELPINLPKIGS